MEKENNNNTNNKKPMKDVPFRSLKKSGPLHMIKVALFMIRQRPTKKSNPVPVVDVPSNGLWKTLVGSMRPLHQLQHLQSPPSPITNTTLQTVDSFVDVLPPPISPVGPDSPSSSSNYSMSQFASAQNLQELDRSEGCEEVGDDNGDKMIDTRAEQFIAHFYEQMKLQRLESFNHYKEMVERGLR